MSGGRSSSKRPPTPDPAAPGPALDPTPSSVSTALRMFALAGMTVLALSLTVFKMSNNDIWIHLKTGEIVLETWSVPDKDPYSFTASAHDYVAHEWLSGVLFYLVHAAAGVNGLIYFKSAIIIATCCLLWATASRFGAFPLVTCGVLMLMLFIGSARFLERPHIFSYLFTALYLFCYATWRGSGNRRWLYLLPLLHVVWVNLHGGHYQGIFLLVMLAAAECVMLVRARGMGLSRVDARPPRDVALVCASPFVCLAAGLLNPYGYRLLTFPFELTGQAVFMKGIYEWQPALFPAYNISSMFFYYVMWTALLFGSFLLVRGHGELKGAPQLIAWCGNTLLACLYVLFIYEFASSYRTPPGGMPTLPERHFALWIISVALFLLFNAHRLEFHHAGVTAIFFAMSMRHNRAVTDAAIATVPALASNLSAVLRRGPSGPRGALARAPDSPAAWLATGAIALGLGLYTFTNSYSFAFATASSPPARRDMGLGIADNMPVDAVNYIERNRITGRAFPSYNAAAILINRMWPDVKVAMDSRNDVYGEMLYREYTRALAGGEALTDYITKWEIDFFLITFGSDRNQRFFQTLDDSPDWALTYFDDRACVYVRRSSHLGALAKRDAYMRIKPGASIPATLHPDQAPEWLAEADRALREAPTAWNPVKYRAMALLSLGRATEAESDLVAVLARSPEIFYAWLDLGQVHERMGRRDLAASDYRHCLELQPGYALCLQRLAGIEAGR